MIRSSKSAVMDRRDPESRSKHARLWRFSKNDRGVAAVEFALILPILVLVLSGIVQLGAIMFLQNHMTNVAREVARRVSIGQWTEVQSETEAQNTLLNWGISYTVDTTLVANAFDATKNDITVDISAPMSDAAIIDVFGLLQSGNLATSVTMLSQ